MATSTYSLSVKGKCGCKVLFDVLRRVDLESLSLRVLSCRFWCWAIQGCIAQWTMRTIGWHGVLSESWRGAEYSRTSKCVSDFDGSKIACFFNLPKKKESSFGVSVWCVSLRSSVQLVTSLTCVVKWTSKQKKRLNMFPELQLSCFIILRFISLHVTWSTGKWMLKKKKSARPTLFCSGPLLQYNNFFWPNHNTFSHDLYA